MLSTSFGCLGSKVVQVVAHPNLFSYCGFADFYASVCGLGDIQGKGFPILLPILFPACCVSHTFSFQSFCPLTGIFFSSPFFHVFSSPSIAALQVSDSGHALLREFSLLPSWNSNQKSVWCDDTCNNRFWCHVTCLSKNDAMKNRATLERIGASKQGPLCMPDCIMLNGAANIRTLPGNSGWVVGCDSWAPRLSCPEKSLLVWGLNSSYFPDTELLPRFQSGSSHSPHFIMKFERALTSWCWQKHGFKITVWLETSWLRTLVTGLETFISRSNPAVVLVTKSWTSDWWFRAYVWKDVSSPTPEVGVRRLGFSSWTLPELSERPSARNLKSSCLRSLWKSTEGLPTSTWCQVLKLTHDCKLLNTIGCRSAKN